ncbi:hypothetical protein TWF481_004857 [Arthrobotrys musiformis]|uniref:Uncharacterized protein n=1 Tax=Arthrobotrys musiformis TaxID=47236 RepID=A0AAV9WL03_9PEZI
MPTKQDTHPLNQPGETHSHENHNNVSCTSCGTSKPSLGVMAEKIGRQIAEVHTVLCKTALELVGARDELGYVLPDLKDFVNTRDETGKAIVDIISRLQKSVAADISVGAEILLEVQYTTVGLVKAETELSAMNAKIAVLESIIRQEQQNRRVYDQQLGDLNGKLDRLLLEFEKKKKSPSPVPKLRKPRSKKPVNAVQLESDGDELDLSSTESLNDSGGLEEGTSAPAKKKNKVVVPKKKKKKTAKKTGPSQATRSKSCTKPLPGTQQESVAERPKERSISLGAAAESTPRPGTTDKASFVVEETPQQAAPYAFEEEQSGRIPETVASSSKSGPKVPSQKRPKRRMLAGPATQEAWEMDTSDTSSTPTHKMLLQAPSTPKTPSIRNFIKRTSVTPKTLARTGYRRNSRCPHPPVEDVDVEMYSSGSSGREIDDIADYLGNNYGTPTRARIHRVEPTFETPRNREEEINKELEFTPLHPLPSSVTVRKRRSSTRSSPDSPQHAKRVNLGEDRIPSISASVEEMPFHPAYNFHTKPTTETKEPSEEEDTKMEMEIDTPSPIFHSPSSDKENMVPSPSSPTRPRWTGIHTPDTNSKPILLYDITSTQKQILENKKLQATKNPFHAIHITPTPPQNPPRSTIPRRPRSSSIPQPQPPKTLPQKTGLTSKLNLLSQKRHQTPTPATPTPQKLLHKSAKSTSAGFYNYLPSPTPSFTPQMGHSRKEDVKRFPRSLYSNKTRDLSNMGPRRDGMEYNLDGGGSKFSWDFVASNPGA